VRYRISATLYNLPKQVAKNHCWIYNIIRSDIEDIYLK